MVSSAVFFDLDSPPLIATTGGMPQVSSPEPGLGEAICRWQPGAVPHPTPLSTATTAAAQRLVNLVLKLRSRAGGWPDDLPQTPDNLAPYISEEVDELAQTLLQNQVSPGDAPFPSGQPQLLATLFPQLLWAIASSGYEIMRLLEGVHARLQGAHGTYGIGIVRLVPVLALSTDQRLWTLDLTTQAEPRHDWLERDWIVQLTDGDLEGSPHPVWHWLATVEQRVSQGPGRLVAWLMANQTVAALCPGSDWLSGTLCLSFHLVMEAAASLTPLNALPQEIPAEPANSFTLDDFAHILEQEQGAWAVPTLETCFDSLLPLAPLTQETQVCLPRSGIPSSEDAIAAWVTITDEAWIQTFLQAVAQDLLCQNLAGQAGSGQANDLVQAVYEATSATQGPDGLFKHTFIHQPMLLADLWPRLRWYLTAAHPRIMQLMGGIEAHWLSPRSGWQRGTLYLQPTLALQPGTPDWWLNLATGQVLWSAPEPIPAGTMLSLPGLEPGPQPRPLADLSQGLETDVLTQALTQLRQGAAIELHRLDADQADQAAYLSLSWQFVLQPDV